MKKLQFLSFLVLATVIFILTPYPSYAHHKNRVLGVSTTSSNIQIPPTVEGPGLILPDSPLFFLDRVKQNVRLLLAITPEEKAKIHTSIAGERLAEMRFMLAKDNQKAVETDLNEISSNFKEAANNLSQAQLSGKDVSTLAKQINDSIKAKREIIGILKEKSDGSMKTKVDSVSESLLESKVEVEDSLKDADLENEIKDDIDSQIEDKIESVSESAKSIEEGLIELKKQASEAAQKSLKKREEVLKKAIDEKNDTLKKVEENAVEREKEKQNKLLKVQDQVALEARKAVEQAKEAAKKYKEAKDKLEEIKTESPAATTSSVSNKSSSEEEKSSK